MLQLKPVSTAPRIGTDTDVSLRKEAQKGPRPWVAMTWKGSRPGLEQSRNRPQNRQPICKGSLEGLYVMVEATVPCPTSRRLQAPTPSRCDLAYHTVTTETEGRAEALRSITRATWTGLVFKGSGD